MLTWFLSPHAPAGAWLRTFGAPRHPLGRIRPGLLLDRAMLTGLWPAYVDCFARGWHQLSTTDHGLARSFYAMGGTWAREVCIVQAKYGKIA